MLDNKKTIDDIKELIQSDLECLLYGFGVEDYENFEGQNIVELALQIVVNRFAELHYNG